MKTYNVTSTAPTDAHGKRIGILVVAYNAVTTIAQVLRRIPPEVWANVAEVLILDDASGDTTYEMASGLKLLEGLEKLTVIKNSVNQGYGGNQKRGYQYFIEKGFDVVVLLHGDGQYAPELLADMYAPIVRGEADAVFGTRMNTSYGGPLRGGMPLYKFVGNKILTGIERFALDLPLTEFHSGYRAYNVHALAEIQMERMTHDFHFDTEIIIKLNHQGYRIKEVPIPTYYGDEICHVNGMRYAKDVVRSVIRYNRTVRGLESYPEFEEYFIHYAEKRSAFSSHYYLRRWLGHNQDVLDLGCGEGFLAQAFKAAGNRVVGVDRVEAPEQASALDEYIRCDLDGAAGELIERLRGRQFQTIVLFDILEHVRQPESLLRVCQKLLAPGGRLLVSLPNVANVYVRLSLLFGMWDYTDRGIVDRTHLRFFTRGTAEQLLRNHGWRVSTAKMSVIPVEALGLPPGGVVARAITALLAGLTWAMPGLFGYQSLFVAHRPE